MSSDFVPLQAGNAQKFPCDILCQRRSRIFFLRALLAKLSGTRHATSAGRVPSTSGMNAELNSSWYRGFCAYTDGQSASSAACGTPGLVKGSWRLARAEQCVRREQGVARTALARHTQEWQRARPGAMPTLSHAGLRSLWHTCLQPYRWQPPMGRGCSLSSRSSRHLQRASRAPSSSQSGTSSHTRKRTRRSRCTGTAGSHWCFRYTHTPARPPPTLPAFPSPSHSTLTSSAPARRCPTNSQHTSTRSTLTPFPPSMANPASPMAGQVGVGSPS